MRTIAAGSGLRFFREISPQVRKVGGYRFENKRSVLIK